MKIIKDNRKIKYLFHYTKKENVNKIIESGKITSSDSYIFFTDSYKESVSLFEDEIESDNYYYDLDGSLKKRTFGNPNDYRIIKIPYYNDNKFVKMIFKNNNDKKNIYNRSVIHEGELYFNKDDVEVLSIPTYSFESPSFVYLLTMKLAFFFIALMPLKTKADTWLDDESYRDVSWFDESNYETTTKYVINTPEKLAGLLYEINIKGYTFEGKTIRVAKTENVQYCRIGNTSCTLDMSEHEWVPIKSSFKGTLDVHVRDNRVYCGAHRILLKSINKKIYFIENDGKCTYTGRYFEHVTGNCPVAQYEMEYSTEIVTEGNGKVKTNSINYKPGSNVRVTMTPDDNNYVDFIEVKDLNDNVVFSKTIYKDNESIVDFSMPESQVKIYVYFKPIIKKECVAISGTGNEIGDEIACDSEHFYVIDSTNDEIKMLSKYNLYTGEVIYKEKIEKAADDTRTDKKYCEDLAKEKGGSLKQESVYEVPGYCFVAIPIDSTKMEQKENAKSAHWDKDGNYLYPQVGDVYITGSGTEHSTYSQGNWDFYINEESASLYGGYFYNLDIGNYQIKEKLDSYEYSLYLKGIDILNIDLMTLDEINKIVKRNNLLIPYSEWATAKESAAPPRYEFAFINGYLTPKQNFLYDTTYWLKTGYNKNDTPIGVNSVIFIDSYGGVCGGALSYSSYVSCGALISSINSQIGCGIRPVITISKKDIKYLINTETDGNGTVEVKGESLGGETIKFKINAKKGYKLKSVIIITSAGEEIEFAEGEITKNNDGTLSIDNNVFTMPFKNVTIQAKFESDSILKNPDTSDKLLIILLLLIISLFIGTIIYKKKIPKY